MIVYPTCPQHSNVLPLFKSGIPSSCPRSTAPNVASFAFSQQSSGSTRFSHVHGTNLPHLTADLLFNAVLSGFLAKIGVRISWSFLTTGVPRNQNTFFELILTLNHYSDIVQPLFFRSSQFFLNLETLTWQGKKRFHHVPLVMTIGLIMVTNI